MTDFKEERDLARNTNFLFVFDDDRENTYSVQNTSTPDLSLGETLIGSQPKDLYIPSNKLETSPIIVQMLVSEDFRELIDMYRWMLRLKNAIDNPYPDLVRTCELITLDSQYKPLTSFIYTDCFPINISSIQYSTQDEASVMSIDITLRYNLFHIKTKDGELITDTFR
jgi:hypothetical protein